MSEEREHESSVTVNFTNNRLPDGTYVYPSGEGRVCPICSHLITDYSSAQFHECALKQLGMK